VKALSRKAPGGPRHEEEYAVRVVPRELVVTDLTVRFGPVTIVDSVSLSVAAGEIVGLIGPNGAGKSTLIDAISGFVRTRNGTVRLGDTDLTREPVHRRVKAGLGRSWQDVETFEDMSVRENLQIGGGSYTWRDAIRELLGAESAGRDVAELPAVSDFGILDDLNRLPGELSFSQRRLVTSARAASLSPSVLLLDEPAGGLSDGRRKGLAQVLRALARDRGMGLLLVEHDMPFVMGLCDRIIALNLGEKIAEGTPAEVRANEAVRASYLRGHDEEEQQLAARAIVVTEPAREQAAERAPEKRAANGGEVLIAAEEMAVGYNGRPVVRGIGLQLHRGEVIALLGANRAGKTTTLLGLAGAIPPLEGKVYCFGERVVKRIPPNKLAELGLAMLSEGRSVFRQLTVAENLRVARCDVDAAMGMFPELIPLRKRKVGLLSGGQQQMVGMCRALSRNPKVLLVDEMSLGLAPMIVMRLMDALRTAADELNVGIVLVEQHVPQALRIADHVCVVAGGRMSLSGPVSEIGHRVDEAFLADVLGSNQPQEKPVGDDGNGRAAPDDEY
jgi:ABC-type branched-subunit amino acid transport system ATPase component